MTNQTKPIERGPEHGYALPLSHDGHGNIFDACSNRVADVGLHFGDAFVNCVNNWHPLHDQLEAARAEIEVLKLGAIVDADLRDSAQRGEELRGQMHDASEAAMRALLEAAQADLAKVDAVLADECAPAPRMSQLRALVADVRAETRRCEVLDAEVGAIHRKNTELAAENERLARIVSDCHEALRKAGYHATDGSLAVKVELIAQHDAVARGIKGSD